MALQVWLPLNGDLTQQGLSGVEVTNNGATINNEGKIGKCYQFGTATSYMNLPAECMTSATEASLSFWVKILSWNASYATLFQAGTDSNSWKDYVFGVLRTNTASTLCFTIGDGNTTSTTTCQTSALELNTWYHLTFTYNSDGYYCIYINGELNKESHTDTIIPAFSEITKITIGRSNGNGYQSNCLMNDVRIYDHCLSVKEIKELSKGLVLHYKLDDLAEEYDNIVFDSSGYKNNGTLISTPTLSTDSARYSKSISFDGADDGILIEDLQLSNIINSEVTYSFWIKPDDEAGARSIYFGSYSGISWSIEKTTGNTLRLYWNSSPDEKTSDVTIADNVWQHICITKKSTNDVKVYINGQQKWSSTAAHNALTFPTTYRIGRDTRSGDGTPYKGLMSDFRIYATALSAEDIAELYHTAASVDNHGNVYAGELKEV